MNPLTTHSAIRSTISQRALLAARLSYRLSREATQRRNAGTRAQDGEKGKSTAKAAAQYGVSTRLVELAKKLLDNGIPDLVRAVDEGKISVSDAAMAAKELPDVQRQALNAVLSGKVKRITEALELCFGHSPNGHADVPDLNTEADRLSYDQNALSKFSDEGVRLLESVHAYDNRHPALTQAAQHLAAFKREIQMWIQFPSPEAYRKHLRGR